MPCKCSDNYGMGEGSEPNPLADLDKAKRKETTKIIGGSILTGVNTAWEGFFGDDDQPADSAENSGTMLGNPLVIGGIAAAGLGAFLLLRK